MDIFHLSGMLPGNPWLALIPAILFAVLYLISKSRFVMATGLFWLVYFLYESGMNLRILCSGECNIRIDLLLLHPTLFIFSSVALAIFAVAVWRKINA